MARPTTNEAKHEPPGVRSLWAQLGVLLLAACVIVARRPDALVHAQFWAEDGKVWFANAYNLGWWHTFLLPYEGYFQTQPRIVAVAALLVPLKDAPLVLNVFAILFQALPVCLLLSPRSSAWGGLGFRVLCAAVYLALPNCDEITLTITNSQWLLALCAFLVLASAAPRRRWARCFEVLILLLCGLTGPFCLFLLPVALLLARRQPWRWARCGVLAATALVQAVSLARHHASRPHGQLGTGFAQFARLLGGRIYLSTLTGHNLWRGSSHKGLAALALLCVMGTVVLAVACRYAPTEMRLFVLFAAVIFAASLVTPTSYPKAGEAVWQMLIQAGSIRYWFFPSLAFAWCILYCLRERRRWVRASGACLLLCLCYGMYNDWNHPAPEDLHFAAEAQLFQEAPPGSAVVLPLNPRGWSMRLVKHGSGR